jgi:hypothetical protein
MSTYCNIVFRNTILVINQAVFSNAITKPMKVIDHFLYEISSHQTLRKACLLVRLQHFSLHLGDAEPSSIELVPEFHSSGEESGVIYMKTLVGRNQPLNPAGLVSTHQDPQRAPKATLTPLTATDLPQRDDHLRYFERSLSKFSHIVRIQCSSLAPKFEGHPALQYLM